MTKNLKAVAKSVPIVKEKPAMTTSKYEVNYTISTKDGRKIRIMETGQRDGIPILVHHGTPGSRLLFPQCVKDAETKGIRLISYERPGYGGSTPQPGRSVADVAIDVAAIAMELKLSSISMWGMSGGGPHALACAALLPDLVVAAAAIASPAPYLADGLDWFAGMGDDNITEFGAALKGRTELEQVVESETPGMLSGTPAMLIEAMRTLLCPADVAVLTEELVSFSFKHTGEGIGERRDGWVEDDLAIVRDWGFQLSQIQIPVMVMQGAYDRMVPYAHGQWLANHIPNVTSRLLSEEGHLSLSVRRIPEVHDWLLSKM